MKDKNIRYIHCADCGGTQGTLVKKGDHYVHMRDVDCKKHRAIEKSRKQRELVLSQARPIPKEVKPVESQQESKEETAEKTS